MAEQMKGITCCGGCAYYIWKKHRCSQGCDKETDPKSHFYDDCPLPDVKPVVHAHWKNLGVSVDGKRIYECTNCHSHIYGTGNFCKECGAQMDEEENDNG